MNEEKKKPHFALNPYFLFVVGVLLCLIPIVFLVRFQELYATAQLPLSVLMALGAGMVTAALPGVFQVQLPGGVTAGGSLGVLVYVLWLANPDAAQRPVEELKLAENERQHPVAIAPRDDFEAEAGGNMERRVTTEPLGAGENGNPERDVTRVQSTGAVRAGQELTKLVAENPEVEEAATDDREADRETLPSGWIYLGHNSAIRGWTTKYFAGDMPEKGDLLTIESTTPRPLMDQSPRLEWFRYDFGKELTRIESGVQVEVEEVRTVGVGKVWARVQPRPLNRG